MSRSAWSSNSAVLLCAYSKYSTRVKLLCYFVPRRQRRLSHVPLFWRAIRSGLQHLVPAPLDDDTAGGNNVTKHTSSRVSPTESPGDERGQRRPAVLEVQSGSEPQRNTEARFIHRQNRGRGGRQDSVWSGFVRPSSGYLTKVSFCFSVLGCLVFCRRVYHLARRRNSPTAERLSSGCATEAIIKKQRRQQVQSPQYRATGSSPTKSHRQPPPAPEPHDSTELLPSFYWASTAPVWEKVRKATCALLVT